MSGICGIVQFDDAPVEPEVVERMRTAMSYCGPDGISVWREGSIALCQFRLDVTEEDPFDVQPFTRDGVTLVAAARLDNREDLLREFKISSAQQSATPDTVLVFEAYLRWGEGAPEHLIGDWQFAAWDLRRRVLFLARDQFGNTALFYHRNGRYLAFASSMKALLAIPGMPQRPDMLRMAQVLAAWPGDGSRTAYENVSELPGAYTLRVCNGQTDCRRYWDPTTLPPLRLSSDQEYFDQFLDTYRQAVRSRLRAKGPIAATLSAGLDSGSVTALAAPMLAEMGKPLTAYTSVPRFDVTAGEGQYRNGDEWELAHATAEMAGNIVHLPVRVEEDGVLAAIERQVEIHDGPGHSGTNYYWILAILDLAQRSGARSLLTGQQGNGTVSYAGTGGWLPQLMRGDWRGALRALRLAEPNAWRTFKRQVAKPIVFAGRKQLRRLAKRNDQPWREYSNIRPDFARTINLLDEMRQAGHDPTFSFLPGMDTHPLFFGPGRSSGGTIWYQAGSAYALQVLDPTADVRLIEFSLRTPDDLFRRRGEERWLIRQTMNGKLPKDVLSGRRKGIQAADIGHRILREREKFTAALDRIEGCERARQCLDIPRMRGILSSLEHGVDNANTRDCGAIVLRALSVGLFLDRF